MAFHGPQEYRDARGIQIGQGVLLLGGRDDYRGFPSIDIHMLAGWPRIDGMAGGRMTVTGQPSVYNDDWIVGRCFYESSEDHSIHAQVSSLAFLVQRADTWGFLPYCDNWFS
jgi:hypothetical protein